MNVLVVYDLILQIVKFFSKNAVFLGLFRNIDFDQGIDLATCLLKFLDLSFRLDSVDNIEALPSALGLVRLKMANEVPNDIVRQTLNLWKRLLQAAFTK